MGFGRIHPSLLGVFLVAVGLLLFDHYQGNAMAHSFGEALIIAGTLAVCVDPFLKTSFARELGRNTFHHLLGYDLPEQIRDRLKNIALGTRVYRKDLTIGCRFEPQTEQRMRLYFEISFEIINPSNDDERYKPYLAFERAMNGKMEEIAFFGEKNYTITAPKLKEKVDEPGIFEVFGYDRTIKPQKSGNRYRVYLKYSVVTPEEFYHVIAFAAPTIGVTLCVEGPPWLEIQAPPGDRQLEGRWEYSRLFMTEQHLNIRWWKKESRESTPDTTI